MSHAGFLRDLSSDVPAVIGLVRLLWETHDLLENTGFSQVLARLERDVSGLPDRWLEAAGDRGLLDVTMRLTIAPGSMTRGHFEAALATGLTEQELTDVVHVACCFAYMNRVADGLGVVVRGDAYLQWARELLGEEALQAHLLWGR